MPCDSAPLLPTQLSWSHDPALVLQAPPPPKGSGLAQLSLSLPSQAGLHGHQLQKAGPRQK